MSSKQSSPVANYFESKEAMATDRKNIDLEHWHNWKQNGQKPEHLEPLLKRFQPMINQVISQWRAPSVPKAAFEAEIKKHLINAFETYDPNRGAALATHAMNRIQKVKRFNAKHQNIGYIPEEQIKHIGSIQKAQNYLKEELERDPSRDEIADHLGMSPKKLDRIMTSMKKDISASTFESDPTKIPSSREHEVLDLIVFNLTPDEKEVFDHIYGREGKRTITSTNDLASALGKNPSQISRLKTSVLNKINSYR